jgi:hypothetical protein
MGCFFVCIGYNQLTGVEGEDDWLLMIGCSLLVDTPFFLTPFNSSIKTSN